MVITRNVSVKNCSNLSQYYDLEKIGTVIPVKNLLLVLKYGSTLMPLQGNFKVIKITAVIKHKMAVNFRSISFITLAPLGVNVTKQLAAI